MAQVTVAQLRIVLVEPAGERNLGSIARVMKNMGFQQLVLVNPRCDPLSADARQMAVHAVDLLESAQQVDRLAEALVGCQRAIATVGRDTTLAMPLESPRTALPWLMRSDEATALIFGREDRGLTNDELNQAQRLVQIPTSSVYPSLNLAQAVAICCYELRSSQITADPTAAPPPDRAIAPPTTAALAALDDLEAYCQHLQTVLLDIGYLYPHTATSRMEKFRHLLHRAYPSPTEVAMLRGILSQIEWALQARSNPNP